MIKTARLPILAFSFDPNGLQCLKPLVESGNAIIVTSTEAEDREKPFCFEKFDKEWTFYKQYFSQFGTVAIDPLTGFADAVMNFILKKDSRAGQVPQIKDYYLLQSVLMDVFREACNIPCDFILTAHVGTDKDEVTGKILTSLMVSGKSSVKIPLLFDNVLVNQVRADKNNTLYGVLTKPDGLYQARCRMEGKFEPFEKPDIMYLRAKGGKSCEHLPPLA
jgi:hypothetical protein